MKSHDGVGMKPSFLCSISSMALSKMWPVVAVKCAVNVYAHEKTIVVHNVSITSDVRHQNK